MPFNAIIHAPRLRLGARLNIAEADQLEARQPCLLTPGAEVHLRIGVCAPNLACGRIIRCLTEPESAGSTVADLAVINSAVVDSAVVDLAVGETTWRLRRSEQGGVAAPGLVSEAWYVVAVDDGTASPTDHSAEYSSGATAAKD